ncbi:BatA domain-containing protein [Pelagicoccus mobilis]|uniref:BatA and WFA domain-containing protein n=1 Tax=Pelagicoccus mobilis TaxID=415221 RepID=A0A934RXI9_9BACT|nr:BatA domain-containing protein [Pelagicoccus mobilis]MBK1877049.1 BatA and WFA domain-containing protein [Pelagicoccus mobilis]
MNFLAPLFLFGILFVAGPVIFHLIRQVPRKRVRFSSTELLDETEPKTEKARKLQNPWLLLLRCLIVALLTFAFARPFFPDDDSSVSPDAVRNNVIIAIDQSASMSRDGIEDNVRGEMKAILSSLKDNDQLSVFTFTDQVSPVLSNDEWQEIRNDLKVDYALELLDQLLAKNRPASLSVALEEAVSQAETMQEDSKLASYSTVYLLSDFSKGTDSTNVDSIEWPQYLDLQLKQILPSRESPNLGLSWEGWTSHENGTLTANLGVSSTHPEQTISSRIVVTTAESHKVAQDVQLLLSEKSKHLIQIEIPNEHSNSLLFFEIFGDEHSFDNRLPVAPTYTPKVQVSLLSDTPLSNPQGASYFVSKALAGLTDPQSELSVDPAEISSNDTYVIDRPLSTSEIASLRLEIESGKHAFLIIDSIESLDTVAALAQSSDWVAKEHNGTPLLIGDIDFKHPFFSPFTDARFSNFSTIQFWEPFLFTPPSDLSLKAVSRFDDGSLLLAQINLGKGSLYVWSGSWAPQKSQWVLSSKFVPFLHQYLLQASGGPSLSSNATLSANSVSNYQSLFEEPIGEIVGFERSQAHNRSIAFQLDSSESDTRPMKLDEWDQLGLPEMNQERREDMIATLIASVHSESIEETEQRQNVWQWILWAVLFLLIAESILAILCTKRKEAVAA